jgi:hypothetical protein
MRTQHQAALMQFIQIVADGDCRRAKPAGELRRIFRICVRLSSAIIPSSGGSAAEAAIRGWWRIVPSDTCNFELPFATLNLLILTYYAMMRGGAMKGHSTPGYGNIQHASE